MPLLNNHSCRLRPPSDIKDGSYRSREQSHNGKKYSVIYGELNLIDIVKEHGMQVKQEAIAHHMVVHSMQLKKQRRFICPK